MSKAKALKEYVKKIQSGSNVEGVVVVRKDGIPIQTSMEKNLSVEYSCLVSKLAEKTQSGLEEIDESDELVSIWAKSGVKEILILKEDDYLLTVAKKVEEEKFDHPDCLYCIQNREGTYDQKI